MRRMLLIVLGLALMAAMISPAEASLMRQDMGLVRGTVVHYNAKTRQLVVDGNRGEGKVSFDLSSAQVTVPTNPGQEVVVIYKVDGKKATMVKPPPKRQ